MYTWKTVESADFVEHASFLVCDDLHRNLGVVQSNFREVCNIAAQWSENGQLDVFSPRDSSKSFSMDKLQEQHRSVTMEKKNINRFILCSFIVLLCISLFIDFKALFISCHVLDCGIEL